MNNDTRFNVELPDAPANMDDTEWQARLELALAYRLVDYYGWTSVVYNHITLQIPGTAHLLINPFGLRYDEVRASDLVKIDLDGNILSATDWPVNLAGYVIHSTIHR
ncbi:MAG: class II aldolase/adducin family protein, partial [Burkholderiaceae bacterium]